MQFIHQNHKILWFSKSRRWRKITHQLITPRRIIRKLHHRHKLHMRKTRFFHISNQLVSQFQIRQKLPFTIASPRTQMHFIYRIRLVQTIFVLSAVHPFFVFPLIVQIPNNRSRLRRMFTIQRKRIGFLRNNPVVVRLDFILIRCAFVHTRNKTFPNARTIPTNVQQMLTLYPIIKIAHHRNRSCRWCPNRKINTFHAIHLHQMRA